jgi:DNA polymerase
MWQTMPQFRAGLPYEQFIACDSLKRLWRELHLRIVQGWKDLKEAAEQAVQHPGKTYALKNKKIMFKVVDRWLYMRLPSGRKIAYYNPRWVEPRIEQRLRDGKLADVEVPGEMRYWGIDTYTRQWMELSTYGGKLCEQGTQATARDILVNGMFNLESGGYPVIGSVHDEAITEPYEGFGSFEEAGKLMCRLPEWAKGLPVAVDGHRGKRYRK